MAAGVKQYSWGMAGPISSIPSILHAGDFKGQLYLATDQDKYYRSDGDEWQELFTGEGIDFTGLAPASHPILFTGITLPDSTNLIRGTGITPTRVSGYTVFTGEVDDTPAQVYTDYRELHTVGNAEVLGIGSFPFADSGAEIASMFAGQDIVEVDPGATVLTAGGAPAIGIFGRFIKVLLNGGAFHSGGVAAALFLSFQANVVDVVAEDTSFLNMEIASGGVRSIFKLGVTASAGATHLFDFTDDIAPIIDDPSLYRDPNAATCDKGLVVRIGSTLYMIPLYVHD